MSLLPVPLLRSLHSLFPRPSLLRSLSTAPPPPLPTPLIGSSPFYQHHLILHTPHSHLSWPAHLETISPLYKALGERWGMTGKVAGRVGFAFSDAGMGKGAAPVKGGKQWGTEGEEVYDGYLYPSFEKVEGLSLSTLDAFEERLLGLLEKPLEPLLALKDPASHIYICVHAARDCRCGDIGEALYQAILRFIRRKKVGGWMGTPEQDGVRIARVSHIGGHKFAANALVYKQGGEGEWYGLLRESNAEKLISHAMLPAGSDPWLSHWRGRLGLTKAAARAMYERLVPDSEKERRVPVALGEQVEVVFQTWDGEVEKVIGYEGESLMEVAVRNDLDSIVATCGGFCECATCHVHLSAIPPPVSPPTTASTGGRTLIKPPADLVPLLPEMTDEEEEQLEFAMGRKTTSRLSCQLPVTKELGEWCKKGGFIGLPQY